MPNNFAVPLDLKVRYLERKKEEIAICRAQIESYEYDAVRTMAHQMRGNAQNFEFPLLEQLGILLESAAQDQNQTQIKIILDDIQQAVQGLANSLHRKMQSS